MRGSVRTLIVCAVVALPCAAQAPDMRSREFVNAALTVMAFDLFVERCRSSASFSSAQTTELERWRAQHSVDQVRARVRELERDPTVKPQIDKSRTELGKQFTMTGDAACTAATALTRLDTSRFATASPEMLRSISAAASPPVTALATAPALVTAPPVAPPASRGRQDAQRATPAASIVALIDRFGFSTRPAMGVGGFIGLKIFPVVMFRDGSVLMDVEGLAFAGGLAAHRAAHADDWTRWRRQGSEYQLLNDGNWKKLAFQNTYSTLPANFRLAGRFRSVSGVGNLAIGGNQSVTVVSEYLFSADGRVVKSGAVGATAGAGDISTVSSQVSPAERGRYRIDGITLVMRFDDGTEEQRILVTDPSDPKSAIWLDGVGYTRRRE
jgi:hypothetical protein